MSKPESASDAYARYEAENFQYSEFVRALDLERKLRGGVFYRLYRSERGAIYAVSVSPCIASGCSSTATFLHAGITPAEAELLAAAEAYWLMQNMRRAQHLELQMRTKTD